MATNEHLLTMLDDLQCEVAGRVEYIKKNLGKELDPNDLYFLEQNVEDTNNTLWSTLLMERIDPDETLEYIDIVQVRQFGRSPKNINLLVWNFYAVDDEEGLGIVLCEELREWTRVDRDENVKDVIDDFMSFLWDTYATADDCDLTKESLALKHKLLSLIKN